MLVAGPATLGLIAKPIAVPASLHNQVVAPHHPGLGSNGDQLESLGEGIIVAHKQFIRRRFDGGDRQQAAGIGMVKPLLHFNGAAEERQEEPYKQVLHLVTCLKDIEKKWGCAQISV